jgi:mannose-6-phosphate isomerase-like protein (cupin superfamily)
MPSPTGKLLDSLMLHTRAGQDRPWGWMRWWDAPGHDLTIKHLTVREGHRTSLQLHQRKDELLIFLDGTGHVEIGDRCYVGGMIRIPPGTKHRVVGPLSYLEVSTYDDDTDTTRLEDDYGRA